MITTHASRNGSVIRVQTWSGDIAGTKESAVCASFHLTVEQAEELILQMQRVISTMPRIGTAADLGCEVL
jgi:hypothetical protein